MMNVCPEAIEHFNKFPVFTENHVYKGTPVPLQTTDFAVRTVCTFKVVQMFAASINAQIYLHAGSHLGAVLHGQPIPWDDDADAFMDFNKRDEFLAICKEGYEVYPGVTAICSKQHNALKMWFQVVEGIVKEPKAKMAWWSPYVDLFLYKKENEHMYEVKPTGKLAEQFYTFEEYFPTVPYYFGGIIVFGPQPTLAENQYNFDLCVTAKFNHRIDTILKWPGGWTPFIDCDDLKKKFRRPEKEISVSESIQ